MGKSLTYQAVIGRIIKDGINGGLTPFILLFVFVIISLTQNKATAATYVGPGIWWGNIVGCLPLAQFQGTSPSQVADEYCGWVNRNDTCAGMPDTNLYKGFPPSIHLSTISYYGSYYLYKFACSRADGVVAQNSLYHLEYDVAKAPSKMRPKDIGEPSCSTRHPIHIGIGNKYEKLAIIPKDLNNGLAFAVMYNSKVDNDKKSLGKAWRHSYDKTIQTDLYTKINLITVVREDGKAYSLKLNGSAWLPSSDQTYSVNQINDAQGALIGWIYNDDISGAVETYNASGKLLSIKDRAGLALSMTYSDALTPSSIASGPGLLIRVNNSFNSQLKFTYDTSNRLSTLTNPAGGVITFKYSIDGNDNLTSVTYPDGKTKNYLYEDGTFPNALTGIIDENGNRYASYYYDNEGRAYSETLAVGADAASLVYNVNRSGDPVSTVVTDSLVNTRTHNFTTILGVVKSTGQSQPGGAGCSASSSKITYDANGNVASRTDFDGHKTTYQYDLNRNLETSRTEGLTAAGLAAAATRTITTTWHATWSLPLVISEYSGASSSGTPLKTTAHTYDDRGNLTSFTESDPALNLNRTTAITHTYSTAVPGLVIGKVVDGPRTDVNDITTYSYYPHDAICAASSAAPIVNPLTGLSPKNLGCRGQLKSVKNALNQTTTYNRYNHHGQVEQMTDANGLVTTMTYDLRQRLTSRTVGTETTMLTYDNAGQVIQLQMPDSSVLNYTYDAAHRLIQVQDSLGNKVFYTLDAEGNRVKEDTTDLKGNLAKTLTRSYDALNRLKTVTGIE